MSADGAALVHGQKRRFSVFSFRFSVKASGVRLSGKGVKGPARVEKMTTKGAKRGKGEKTGGKGEKAKSERNRERN
jgi:hypothetical protein